MIFKINQKTYNTKESLKRDIQKIFSSSEYGLNEFVNEEHKNILNDLLKYHPYYKEKIGCGILGFKIYLTKYKNKSFRLIRVDGSSTDFSYLKCITNPSLLTKIKHCCRSAINKDILIFKDNLFENNSKIICPVTEEILTKDFS